MTTSTAVPRPLTFVLVHGAWHTGRMWDAVAAELRGHGHRVFCPTIDCHSSAADRDVSHGAGVNSLLGYIRDRDLDDIVLLGHSFGGTYVTKAAETLHGQIRRLVIFNGFVLEDGSSVFDEVPPAVRRQFRRSAAGDGTVMPPFAVWREQFMNDASHELAARTYKQLTPVPIALFEEHLDLAHFHQLIADGALAASFLHATGDTALPHGPYSWHPRFTERLGNCRLVQADGGHELLVTGPRLLARKINEAGRD